MFRVANIETRILAFILAIGVVTLACGPTDVVRDILLGLPTATPAGRSGRGFAFIWYVSVSGDDSNTVHSLTMLASLLVVRSIKPKLRTLAWMLCTRILSE